MKTIQFERYRDQFVAVGQRGHGCWLCGEHTIDSFGLSVDCDGIFVTISTTDRDGFNAITMLGKNGNVVLPNGNTHWLMDGVRQMFVELHGTDDLDLVGLPRHDITLYVKVEEYHITKTLRMCNLKAEPYQF